MNLTPIKANMTELEINGSLILFSYKTPVAVLHLDGNVFKTSKFWSRTTSRHINQWLVNFDMEKKPTEKPQEYFDTLLSEVK
jgi:hypothetical protein